MNKNYDNEVISNSIFEVMDNEGMVIYNGITNEDGIIKVDNLLLGSNYCIKQTKVLDSYLINKEEVCILLDNDKEINFVNDMMVKETIRVPNTLSTSIGFYELLLGLIMIGTGYLVYKKIFVSKLYR